MGSTFILSITFLNVTGINLRTGEKGIFPVAHVVDVDYNDFDPAGVEVIVENTTAEYS